MKWLKWIVRPLVAIDAALLRAIERAAARIQWLTGYDCFSQALFCHRLAGGFILAIALIWVRVLTESWLRVSVWGLLLAAAASLSTGNRNHSNKREWRARGYSNYGKASGPMIAVRLLMVALDLFFSFWSPWFVAVMEWLILLGIYLESCDPEPPAPAQIREWWQAFTHPPARSLENPI